MFRIGQHPSNDLVLRDKAAEDYHCLITINTTGEIQVEDLQSRYGTLVNGRRIQRHTLKSGDELQIGFTRIEWEKLLPAFMELDRVEHLPDRDGDSISLQGPLDMAEALLHKEDPRVASPEELDLANYTLDVRQELIEALNDQLPKKELDYIAEPTLPEILPDNPPAPKIEVHFDYPFTEHIPGKTTTIPDSEPSSPEVTDTPASDLPAIQPLRLDSAPDLPVPEWNAADKSTSPKAKAWPLAWWLLGILVAAWIVVMVLFAAMA